MLVLNKDYPVPVGHTITIAVVDGHAFVRQLENPSISAMVSNSAPQVFGPYALPRNFRVQDTGNVTVTVAESDFAANVPSTAQAAMLDAIPAEDAEDSATVWNDQGILKVSSAGE